MSDPGKTEDLTAVQKGKLGRFFSKSPGARAESVKRRLWRFWHGLQFRGLKWAPRGKHSVYLAYYPDSTSSFQHLGSLYAAWTRGNSLNNNGDVPRFMALMLNLRQLEEEGIQGDFAELGVWKGNSAAILADYAAKKGRRVLLFDTYEGFDTRDLVGLDKGHDVLFRNTSIDYVRQTVGHDDITTYVKGYFPDSLTDDARSRTYALAHIDCDLYQPMKEALAFFYPRMPKGGMLIMHDYSSGAWAGAKQAIDEFCLTSGEFVSLWPDKSGTAMIRKSR